jgi:hypothetical protein
MEKSLRAEADVLLPAVQEAACRRVCAEAVPLRDAPQANPPSPIPPLGVIPGAGNPIMLLGGRAVPAERYVLTHTHTLPLSLSMCVCICVRVSMCVCVCVCVYARVCMFGCGCLLVSVILQAHSFCHANSLVTVVNQPLRLKSTRKLDNITILHIINNSDDLGTGCWWERTTRHGGARRCPRRPETGDPPGGRSGCWCRAWGTSVMSSTPAGGLTSCVSGTPSASTTRRGPLSLPSTTWGSSTRGCAYLAFAFQLPLGPACDAGEESSLGGSEDRGELRGRAYV